MRVSCRRIVAHDPATLATRRRLAQQRDCRSPSATTLRSARAWVGCARWLTTVPLGDSPSSTRRSASLPERYLGADPGLRRHLPGPAVRHRPHLGGPLHAPRRPRAQGRHPPPPRRDDQHDCRHLDARCARASCRASRRSTERLLDVRGNLDYAVAFEGMFRLPNGRPPLLQIHDVPVGRHRISTLTMGRGPRRAAAPRARRHARVAVRDRGGAQPGATASTLPTCPASARRPSPPRAPTPRAGSPRSCSG